MARPPVYTDDEILEAANKLAAQGLPVSPFAVYKRIGGGGLPRIKRLLHNHYSKHEPTPASIKAVPVAPTQADRQASEPTCLCRTILAMQDNLRATNQTVLELAAQVERLMTLVPGEVQVKTGHAAPSAHLHRTIHLRPDMAPSANSRTDPLHGEKELRSGSDAVERAGVDPTNAPAVQQQAPLRAPSSIPPFKVGAGVAPDIEAEIVAAVSQVLKLAGRAMSVHEIQQCIPELAASEPGATEDLLLVHAAQAGFRHVSAPAADHCSGLFWLRSLNDFSPDMDIKRVRNLAQIRRNAASHKVSWDNIYRDLPDVLRPFDAIRVSLSSTDHRKRYGT